MRRPACFAAGLQRLQHSLCPCSPPPPPSLLDPSIIFQAFYFWPPRQLPEMSLPTRNIGGLKVPALGLGCMGE